MKELEFLILGSYIHIPDYYLKTNSQIKSELFESEDSKLVFSLVDKYIMGHKNVPTQDAMLIELKSKTGISQESINLASELIRKLYTDSLIQGVLKQDIDWLLDKTKSYLTNRACYNAIMESLDILDTTSKSKKNPDAIPDLLRDALSIDFDSDVGHDYAADYKDRLTFYHNTEEKVPFSLTMLNKVVGGAMPKRSLVVPVAATGVGKSLFMTDQAAYHILNNRCVLYISLEMSAEKIAERVDAKLMGINIWDVSKLSEVGFVDKFKEVCSRITGKLIIKAYAPGTFNANHLRGLLTELKQKQGMIPDVVMIDYLGLMSSYRVKTDVNSYGYLKACSEELRGVALENNHVCISPMQTNRSGITSQDPQLDNLADSMGVAHTADLIFSMSTSPELEQSNLCRFKLLKNRNGSLSSPNSWVVNVDKAKMTLSDADMPNSAQAAPRVDTTKSTKTALKF